MTQDDGCVDYLDLLKALNWRDASIEAPKLPAEEARLNDDPKNFEKTTHERKKFNVQYSEFLKDLGLNTTNVTVTQTYQDSGH